MSNAGQRESEVWVYTIDGRIPPRRILTLPAGRRIRGLTWFPDKTKLIVGLSERTSDIVLFDQGS
jgi:hypothetical protein